MSDVQAIKAELYDLQWYEYEGRFTVHADGHFDTTQDILARKGAKDERVAEL